MLVKELEPTSIGNVCIAAVRSSDSPGGDLSPYRTETPSEGKTMEPRNVGGRARSRERKRRLHAEYRASGERPQQAFALARRQADEVLDEGQESVRREDEFLNER